MNKVEVKIKDIANVKNGSTPSTSQSEYYDGDIIWITPKDLSNQNSRYIRKGERTISKDGFDSCSATMVPQGTILLSSRAPIGLLSIADVELCTNQGFKNIVPDVNKINSEFLYYYLKIKISDLNKLGSGTTFKEISKNSLENYKIIIPENPVTQQKIAAVLSSLDSKIELNNRINSELEAMAKTLYDYWFVQFDFPDANGKPYKSSGGKMIWNNELKREIPEGWVVKRFKDVSTIIMGQSPKGESYNQKGLGIPLLNGPADYDNGSLFARTYTTEPTRLCKKDDLVFCIRATIGNLTYAEKEFCLGRGVAAVRPNKKYISEILYYSLLQEIERFKVHASGSIIIGITKDDLTDSYFIEPTNNLVERFHKILNPIFCKQRLNKIENQQLTTLRDWLLPMLMNGQVKVN